MQQMQPPTTPRRWPGFDRSFGDRVARHVMTPEGESFRGRLREEFNFGGVKPLPVGPPVLVGKEYGSRLCQFTRAYHAAIESIVEASRVDPGVQGVLSIPEELRDDLAADQDPNNGHVHICRIDLFLGTDGGFKALETNANCPGLLIYGGDMCRIWREYLSGSEIALPEPLASEDPSWVARWFLDAAEGDTHSRPTRVPLLRPDGGNRLELEDQAERFRSVEIDCFEVDPREVTLAEDGTPMLHGEPLRHAYLKVSIPDFCRLRPELDSLVTAIRERRLFVQNGLRGRWVGDSKLCLAILSDPAFEYLFDPAVRDLLAGHIPESRNAALCASEDVERIRGDRGSYVLKRALDTRGHSVVVGREVDAGEWARAVEVALREAWLVQEFVESTRIEADFDDPTINHHDLALGAINGRITSAFVRSSPEFRVNVARSGRMHPVFIDRV